MMKSIFFLLLCYFVLFSFGTFIMDQPIDLDFGKSLGITKSSTLPPDTLTKIMSGVESGNPDNIYFYGLLKLYGIEVAKDIQGAFEQFHRATTLGHKEAPSACAVMIINGQVKSKDYNDVISYLKTGIERSDMNSFWLMGKMLMEGKGVPKVDYFEASNYIKVAAESGIPQAEHTLGLMYEYGYGVPYNLKQAAVYYKRATEKNYLESMYNLALMYAYGRGFPQDYNRARSLLDAAAMLNHGPSMYYIGVFKAKGYGCRVNYDQAIHWFERASVVNDHRIEEKAAKAAKELREFVAKAREYNEDLMNNYQKKSESKDL